MSMLKAKGLPR
jgi:hypothetical protein